MRHFCTNTRSARRVKEYNGNLRIDNLEGLREQMTTGLLGPIRSRPSWKKIDGKWDSTIPAYPEGCNREILSSALRAPNSGCLSAID